MKFASLECFKVAARTAPTELKTLVPLPGSALDPRGTSSGPQTPRRISPPSPRHRILDPPPAPPMIVNTSTFTIKIRTSTIFHRLRELFGWFFLYFLNFTHKRENQERTLIVTPGGHTHGAGLNSWTRNLLIKGILVKYEKTVCLEFIAVEQDNTDVTWDFEFCGPTWTVFNLVISLDIQAWIPL